MESQNTYYIICITHHYYSCGTKYRGLKTTKSQSYKDIRGNVRFKTIDAPLHIEKEGTVQPDFKSAPYKFKSADEALTFIHKLQKDNILPCHLEIKINDTAEYGSTKDVISILKRPMSDIVGKYRAWALEMINTLDYDNEHRYQLKLYQNYLIYDSNTKECQYTTDRSKATFFTLEEAENVKREYTTNGIYHLDIDKLPYKLGKEPLFKKGDKVVNADNEKGIVVDVAAFEDGKYHYSVEFEDMYVGYSTYYAESFFHTTPFSILMDEDELTKA